VTTDFKSDTTLRWPCRAGDYLLWAGCRGFGGSAFDIDDFWELRDGNHVTITNRFADLPGWFQLHPLEASGSNAYRIMERLNEGMEVRPPYDGPNLWRVFAGGRIA
jgi:hypothetical protein